MGSGSFPLYRSDEDAKVLLEVVEKIDDFIEEYVGYVYSGDSGGRQFDNAAIDGGYLEKLRIAKGLIKECIRDE